jgi:UDP-N-acetylglucosamine 3-dehydrogenase
MDMGVHDFDWLRWCLGPVERVSALAHPNGQMAMMTLAHTTGALSTVELSWMEPRGFATSVEVSGPGGLLSHDSREAASFTLDLWPSPLGGRGAAQPSGEPASGEPASDGPDDPGLVDDPYRHELSDALTWFAGGAAPRSTALDGVAAVALAEAALASASTREPVVMTEAAVEGAG